MTIGGMLTDQAQKKMLAFVAKLGEIKGASAAGKVFDSALSGKAHAALRGKGWKPTFERELATQKK